MKKETIIKNMQEQLLKFIQLKPKAKELDLQLTIPQKKK